MRRVLTAATALTAVAAATAGFASVGGASTPAETTTVPAAPPTPVDTTFLRAQAEAALGAEHPELGSIACQAPSEDAPGVIFVCYGTTSTGTVASYETTVNDDGGIQFSESGAVTASEPASAGDYSGTDGGLATVEPIVGPTLVTITRTGSGEFSVQPQQSGAAVGGALAITAADHTGRYLVGVAGPIDTFAVTGTGEWTITVAPATSAQALTAESATGVGPDVLSFVEAEPQQLTLATSGAGPLTVVAVTAAGAATLLESTAPSSEPITLPRGPGYLTIVVDGPWELSAAAAAAPTDSGAVG